MAGSTYSTNLKIELMTTGENSGTWGDITNTNLGTALEQAVVGYGNPDYASDANLTISITNSNAAQPARALVLNVTSTFGSLTQTRELVVPTIQKQYIVQNNTTGGQSITVKTSAGTGITVPNGRKAHLYVNGTDVIQMFDFVNLSGGTIDNMTIGATTASSGKFTTLNASGATTLDGAVALGNAAGDLITVPGTVNSHVLFTDNTYDIGASGATRPRNLFLAGAATVGGNLSVGGTLTLTGGVNLNGNVTVGDSAADTLTINSTVTSHLIFTDNTYDIGASGATRPRNLFIAGNITAGGSQTLTGALTVDSTTDTSSATTGSIQTDGGVGIAKGLYVGGNTTLGDASADTVTVNGTVTSNLIFTDNTYDIGASGATRPRNLFLAGNATVGGNVVLTGSLDLTNLEVTNIKAKDGTAAMTIADSTGAVTVSSAFSTQGNTTLGNAAADNVTVTGTITSNLIFTDNTYDIGASGATRPRTGYFGTSLITPLIDATNVEVTNIKALDGTASISLADTTGIATFSKATVISTTDNTNAALRITQTGTGNALLVEDSSNPDATPFVIDANGKAVIGNTTAITTTESVTAQLQVHATNDSGAQSINIWGAAVPQLQINRAGSGGIGTYTALSSGNSIGKVTFGAADGTAFVRAAEILAAVDGTPGTSDMPGRLVFSTTADGASTPTERVRIDSAGQTKFSYNTVVEVTDNTNAALRITQTGTGNALLVEDATNPDSTPFVIDNFGDVINGYTTPLAIAEFTSRYQQHGNTQNFRSLAVTSWQAGTDVGAELLLARGDNTSIGDYTLIGSTDVLGNLRFYGADGTQMVEAAKVSAVVDGTPGTNDMPGRLVFSTTADGASSPTERVRITSAGKTGFATSAPAATVHVAGNTILSNVNVIGASYDSVSFSIAGEELSPTDVFFSPDGLKMYVVGSTGDDVNEYNLSTAWVVSSAVYSTVFSVASQDTLPTGLFFRADGTKMYIVGSTNDTVYQYTLSTPWSVATASYDSISFSVASQDGAPTGLWFEPNGLSMYIIGSTNDAVYQYTLSTAWNVSTATFLQSFSVSGQETVTNALTFTGDGSRMFVMGSTGDDVNVYNLTTPWDISTSNFVNVFSVASQDTQPQGFYIKPDGTKMYMVGTTNDAVYQYTVPSIDIQLTGPTSVAALNVQQDLTVYGNTTGSFLNNGFRENIGGQYYNLVSQADIGTAPNEIPLNQYLGEMAYMNAEAVVIQPQASAVPNGIGDMVFQLTSDTSLEIKVKGSDGTVRSVTLTLA